MLDSFNFDVCLEKSFSVGGVDASSWGGLEPVYVTKYPSFVLAQDYSKGYINDWYPDLLKRLNICPERTLDFKVLGFNVFACSNAPDRCNVERIYVPLIRCGTYHPWNSFKHSSRCVARILDELEQFEKLGADYVIHLDLTFPRWVSLTLRENGTLERARKAFRYFLREISHRLFHMHHSLLGAWFTLHIWKTTKPSDPHLHIHAVIPNLAYNPKTKTLHRFQPWISVHLIREFWVKALRKYGLWDAPGESCDVHVRYIKLEERPKVIHRLRYMFRKPILDINEFPGEWGDLSWARFLLDFTPRRYRAGFLSNVKRFGIVLHSRNPTFERCPICGGNLIKIEKVACPPPGTPWLSRQRDGSLILCYALCKP